MDARCPRCSTVFTTDRSGIQFCPNCGQQVDVPEPTQASGGWGQSPGPGPGAGSTGNLDRLRVFGQRIRRLWRLVLSRRSQSGMLSWDRLKPLFARWIPVPRVLHPYPMERFAASHPRWEPYA